MKKKTIKAIGLYTLATAVVIAAGYGIYGAPNEASASADYDVSKENTASGDTLVSDKASEKDVTSQAEVGKNEEAAVNNESIAVGNEGGTGKSATETEPETLQPPTANQDAVTDVDEAYKIFDNTLFIGDSRTEGFMYYAGVDNANYYCGKSMTVDKILEGKKLSVKGESISVYDALAKKDYDMIFISAGLNELGWYSIDSFLDTYGRLIDAVREKQPGAKIYLQAVLPVTAHRSDRDATNNNTQIYWYNVNIIDLANQKGVNYINAAPAVVDNEGFLYSDSTSDGIHLNKTYCEKWAQYLAAKLKGEVE